MSNGLPSLPAGVNILTSGILLVADAVTLISSLVQQWGIFLDGFPVILADNVLTMGFGQDWRIASYTQEQGAFASYNKVTMPFVTKLRFSTGGSVSARQAFIDSVMAISGDTNLYDVVTPERIYTSCNVEHASYDRNADTAGMVSMDVWLKQIAVTDPSTYTNPQNPCLTPQQQNGLCQAGPQTQTVISVKTLQ